MQFSRCTTSMASFAFKHDTCKQLYRPYKLTSAARVESIAMHDAVRTSRRAQNWPDQPRASRACSGQKGSVICHQYRYNDLHARAPAGHRPGSLSLARRVAPRACSPVSIHCNHYYFRACTYITAWVRKHGMPIWSVIPYGIQTSRNQQLNRYR